jgi:hypothetical protein
VGCLLAGCISCKQRIIPLSEHYIHGRYQKDIFVLFCNVEDPDPGSSVFLTPGSGSGISISESLVTIFWIKNT